MPEGAKAVRDAFGREVACLVGRGLTPPGALHHAMVRGIERRVIFRDDRDRADFVARLAALAEGGVLTIYAWALLPNHFHLLVRRRTRPLARACARS